MAPWVPMRTRDLKRVFELAKLKDGQIFYDLGCGNGKVVLYAAKNFNCNAIGIEIGIPLYIICVLRKLLGRVNNATFKFKSLFSEDISKADVVYLFGMSRTLKQKMVKKLLTELKPGARIISYVFEIEGLSLVEASKGDFTKGELPIYLYVRS